MSAVNEGEFFDGPWKAAMSGDYLAAVGFDGRKPTFRIATGRIIPLESQKLEKDLRDGTTAKIKDKLVLFFEPGPGCSTTDKGWVMNQTNAQCMEALWGERVADWFGKRVTLMTEEVSVGRGSQLGIRILGSPDIDRPVDARIKLPRRRAVTRRLIPTGRKPQRPPAHVAALRQAHDADPERFAAVVGEIDALLADGVTVEQVDRIIADLEQA